jgi:biopolymer transport protein TolQ
MTQDLSITALVLQASLVVQLVMAGLAITSLTSWTVIFGKVFGLRKVRGSNDEFEREFWSGRSLTELNTAVTQKSVTAPMERIFASGMREFLKLREKRLDAGAQLDGARRAMRASFQRELDVIESNLSFLASVGSVSPYVGLFGTVWGIMHAFVGLSNMQQVTLATVAPGIAEALVATAIGLFAAIPAVVAYNRFARDIDRIAIQLETFIEEFSNILQRNSGQAGSTPRLPARGHADAAGHHPRPRGRRSMNEINMVPFIDVMLVLLIIFMVTAPLITTGVVDLPSVGKSAQRPTSVVEVIVGSDEKLRLRVDQKEPEGVLLAQLARGCATSRAATPRCRWSSAPTATCAMKVWCA